MQRVQFTGLPRVVGVYRDGCACHCNSHAIAIYIPLLFECQCDLHVVAVRMSLLFAQEALQQAAGCAAAKFADRHHMLLLCPYGTAAGGRKL